VQTTPDDPIADDQPVRWGGALATPLAALDDPEEPAVPPGLPPVIDAHVHVFPDRLMEAVRRWFDEHGWPARYRLTSEELVAFLLGRGVDHLVLLHYAHRRGMARDLNGYVAGLCRGNPRVTGLATVFPGEEDVRGILEEAFGLGLAGVKLHQHVQCFDPSGPEMWEVAGVCAAHDKPLVAHLGREPRSPAYKCDPHRMCAAAKTERLLRDFPGLRLCVPHLGADEFEAHARLAERYDNLWLDTTMMLSGFFPGLDPPPLTRFRADRVMYGTDFCNLPHAWDRELVRLARMGLPREHLTRVLGGNAREFFALNS
jgi:predicted TIM-barrel fold metal-dependent hydrolase